MAGTTQTIKRSWGKVTSSVSNFVIDQMRAFFEQHNNIITDLETLRGSLSTDTVALVNQLRTSALSRALGNPGFAISTNFDVKNVNAISYSNAGTLKTLAANTNFDTGTAQVIAINKWSAALLSVDSSGAAVLTWSATLNAASEAAAIAALPTLPAGNTPLGYVTVLTGSGVTFTAGTDALQGGTGGTPATTTNYYNSINPNAAQIGSAVTAKVASDLVASSLATVES